MIRETWRAVLVVVTAALLREIVLLPRPVVPATTPAVATNWQAPPPTVATGWQQAPWQPPTVATWPQPDTASTRGPLRRVAKELVDLAETVVEVIR